MKKSTVKKSYSVDFAGVTTSGSVPEDNYQVKVEDATLEEGPKAPYVQFKLKISEGEFKGKLLYHICTLAHDGLFNLKATLEALGIEIQTSKMDINPAFLKTLKGLEMGVSTENEIYKKKERSRVVDVFSLEERPSEEEGEEREEESTDESSGEEGEGEEEEESPEENVWTEEEAQEQWDGLQPTERTKQANEAGLEGKWGKKLWADLTEENKSAMYNLAESESETEEESGGDEESGEEPVLADMDLKALIKFAKERKVKLTDNQKLSAVKARMAIQVALDQ